MIGVVNKSLMMDEQRAQQLGRDGREWWSDEAHLEFGLMSSRPCSFAPTRYYFSCPVNVLRGCIRGFMCA